MLFKFALICLLGMASCQEKDILPPITTTNVPDTTTPAHTTTAPPETTTPPATTTTPASTTTPAATTTAAPAPTTPPPPAEVGSWNVTDSVTNDTCIMAKMALQLSIPYGAGDPQVMKLAVLDVPTNTSIATGSCGNDTQSLTISWTPEGANQIDSVLLFFTQNATAKTYHLSAINITIYPDAANFPGATSMDKIVLSANASVVLPTAPLAMSYRCLPAQTLSLTANATLSVSELQLQAFHAAGDTKFGAVTDCAAGDSADIVPIAVGCALAGLVVIVLVAYLIGRRRSHAKGYLSM